MFLSCAPYRTELQLVGLFSVSWPGRLSHKWISEHPPFLPSSIFTLPHGIYTSTLCLLRNNFVRRLHINFHLHKHSSLLVGSLQACLKSQSFCVMPLIFTSSFILLQSQFSFKVKPAFLPPTFPISRCHQVVPWYELFFLWSNIPFSPVNTSRSCLFRRTDALFFWEFRS